MKKNKSISTIVILPLCFILLSCDKPIDSSTFQDSSSSIDNSESSSVIETTKQFLSVDSITLQFEEKYCVDEMLIEQVSNLIYEIQNTSICEISTAHVITATRPGKTNLLIKDENDIQNISINITNKGENNFFMSMDKGRLKDKVAVFYGDSITYNWGYKNYVDYIKEQAGLKKAYNLGISGDTMCYNGKIPSYDAQGTLITNERTGVGLIQANVAKNREADFAFLFFGTNDFARGVEIGSPYDNPKTLEEATTFYGAMNLAIETLKSQNQNIQIIYINLLFRQPNLDGTKGDKNVIGLKITDYIAAIHQECLDYEIKEIYTYDLWDTSTMYYYSTDGLHPTTSGHKFLADYILSK